MTVFADSSVSAGLSRAGGSHAAIIGVRTWLFTVAAFVFAMVVIGGATRLTGSGLSITEWQPIVGTIPPLTDAAWLSAFEKYRQIPEFRFVNPAMDLSGFKAIYWWEWTHRLLGRLIGLVFLLPFLYFLIRRSIPRAYIWPVAALFILGSAQGVLGWLMVKSGLSDRVDVSQYRLAAHLALATAIAGYAFWLGLTIEERKPETVSGAAAPVSGRAWAAGALAALISLQIVAGAFVAGLKAGHASNSWPLMNGAIIPEGLGIYEPWYFNLFENPVAAQFAHRMLGYMVALFAIGLTLAVWKQPRLRTAAFALCLAVLLQIALGIATILYEVPLTLALAHQANAMAVLALALWLLRLARQP
jgi:heme a synthase